MRQSGALSTEDRCVSCQFSCIDNNSSTIVIAIGAVSYPASGDRPAARAVFGVIPSFQDSDLIKVERAKTVNAGYVHAVLGRDRAPGVKSINPAYRAEVVPRLSGVELVERQFVLALMHMDVIQVGRHCHSASHAAVRAVASPRTSQTISQHQSEPHGAAMAFGLQLAATVKVGWGQICLHESVLKQTTLTPGLPGAILGLPRPEESSHAGHHQLRNSRSSVFKTFP